MSVLITSYDPTFVRGTARGHRIEWNVGSVNPIVKVEVDLEGDGESPKTIMYPSAINDDGRFFYGIFWKPVRTGGPFPLTLRVWDALGGYGEVTCSPGVTVTQ